MQKQKKDTEKQLGNYLNLPESSTPREERRSFYFTVTLLAKFLGLSGSRPFLTAKE